MNVQRSIRTILLVAGLAVAAVPAHAGLVATAGGLGVYDTVNNVTWTSDGNLFATQAANFGGGATVFVSAVIAASGGVVHDAANYLNPTGTYTLTAGDFDASTGQMNRWGALAWVNYLNATNYAGTNQWTLPTTVDSPTSQGYPDGTTALHPQIASSQLAQLFYGNLGQIGGASISTSHNSAYALFSHVQDAGYWSGTIQQGTPGAAWYYTAVNGSQTTTSELGMIHVLALTSGQVSAVPLPGSIWLLGSSLLGLVGISRRRLTGASLPV